jgi:hypothetical protein
MMLYQSVELPSDKPVQYVGVYVLKWGKVSEPTHGFVEIDEDWLIEFASLRQQYPNEPVLTLLEMALNSSIEEEKA